MAGHLDLDTVHGHTAARCLDEESVGEAAPEHAKLQFRRGRAEVVAGEVGRAVAEHLEVVHPGMRRTPLRPSALTWADSRAG